MTLMHQAHHSLQLLSHLPRRRLTLEKLLQAPSSNSLSVPPNDLPEPENNWENALTNSHIDPEENKLLRKTGDMGSFITWFCKRIGKKKLSKSNLEGPAYKVAKAFHENSISLQLQMEDCHRMVMDQVDLVNPEGHRLVPDVSKPLPLEGPPGQVTIQSQFFFNKDLEYLVSSDKGRRSVLSISKLKAAQYLDFGLKELVPSGLRVNVSMILALRTVSLIGGSSAKNSTSPDTVPPLIVLHRADYKEYKILEADFKNLHPNDFEDLYLPHLQGQLNHLSGDEKVHLFNAVNLWIRNIIIKKHVEDVQLRIESYQIKLNLTQPDWDASYFLFKEDYTIVRKPRNIRVIPKYHSEDGNPARANIKQALGRFLTTKVLGVEAQGAAGYLEFFDCPGSRQGVEDLREGAQGDREAEVFQVSNDDTTVDQRWLKDKQPKEKTNTDCLVKEQEKEYQTEWKIKTGNVLGSCNQSSTQQCIKSRIAKYLGVAGIQQQNGLVDETNVILFAKVTIISDWFKTPVGMLGFFGWLASIKKGILESVKVKCIFLGYHKSIVGNKLWRLDDVTSKVVLYRNMGFNESGEYKKTFIGFGVGTGSMQVFHGFEFEVEPLGDHTFELARDRDQHLACELFGYKEDSNGAAFAFAVVEKMYAHESLTFNSTVACEVISKWKAGLKDDTDARSDAEIWATKGLLDKAKENVLGLEIIRDQSGNTLRVSQSKIHNEKLVQTLLKGHSTLSLEDSLSGDCDVEKNGKWSYICSWKPGVSDGLQRPNIASASVDMLDGFDRGLQTNVQVFVDFDYAMGRSITVMSRSITGYGLMILGCAGSLKANLQHMEALSTTDAGYMTFTEAWKKKIWLKGLLTESRYELRLVAGIATGALVKGCSRSEVPAQVKVVAYRY
ncbi:hypothetical protein Tco_0025443 [Tanacetum coccineum]